ncbi:MAG TPA: flagellin, partial [Bdellovibrionales bacterium]|nr:flagellin [Bdellovibrionales bacterium]
IRALSSGSRIVSAGDDAAGFAIAESLRGQAASLRVAKQNADNAVGLIQVAEGGLNEQNNILVRLRELAIQAASDTVGDDERGFLDTEFQQLVQEFDRIAETTRYGGKQLLVGESTEYEFHLGTGSSPFDIVRYKLDADTRASSAGISGMGVSDQDEARDLLEGLDEGLMHVAKARAGFGAIQSRLQIAGNNLDIQRENIMGARGRIVDADIAYEVSEMVQGQIQQDFGVAVLQQANQNPQRAIRLLG